MKTGIIYCIKNTVNSKLYIGKTVGFQRRMNQHRNRQARAVAIGNAIEKYGWEQFEVRILHENVPINQLDWLERHCIWIWNTLSPDGYNLTTGGEGALHSNETRKRLSEIGKASVKNGTNPFTTDEHRRRNSKVQLQRIKDGVHQFLNLPPESREQITQAVRDKVKDGTHNFFHQENPFNDPEVRERITQAVRDRVKDGTHNFFHQVNPA